MFQDNEKIEKVISEEGFYVGGIQGHSMEPMLNCDSDSVVIISPSGRLEKYDIALYRANGKYVLHRVVKVLPDSYVFCGDNCDFLEKGIKDSDIIGVLSEVFKGEKKIDLKGRKYRAYCRRKVAGFYPRKAFRSVRRAVLATARRIIKTKGR